MTTKFKVGDKVRRIANDYNFAPIGFESEVIEYRGSLLYTDRDGDKMNFEPRDWELITHAFDATKLRKGDKVLVAAEVLLDGVDRDGEVVVSAGSYVHPDRVIGYAPGYTPAEEPLKVGDKVLHQNTGDHGKPGEIVWLDDAYATVRWPASGVSTYSLPDLRRVID